MTREEAREILTHNWTRVDNPNYSESELDEAFFTAIEALSADTVSREEHFDAVANRITDMEERGFVSVVRCKDCKFKSLYEDDDDRYYYCALEDRPNRNWSVDDTDFCSWGERREP